MTTATWPLLLALRSTLFAVVACLGLAAQVRASPEVLIATVPDAQVALFQRDSCGTTEAEFETPQRAEKRGHIFVSIASYRDQACKRTIADLFAKAAHPERITVGVVQQNKAGSAEDCIAGCALCAEKQRLGQILVKDYDYTQARGPAFARWAASRLWEGSEFYLQIDAHSNFQPYWDQSIIAQHRALGDPDAILTHHPPAPAQIETALARGRTSLNCLSSWDEDGIFQQFSRFVDARGPLPVRSPFAAAGFLFMPARALHEVPFDPYLVFLFHPEEALLSMRLWTAGFNLYAPVRPVISHEYHRARSLRFYERANKLQTCRARAVTRAQYLLGVITRDGVDPAFRAGLDRYGVGHARSLADFYAYVGLENPGLTLIDDLGLAPFDRWAGGPLAAAVPMGDSAPIIKRRCRRPPAAKMSGRP